MHSKNQIDLMLDTLKNVQEALIQIKKSKNIPSGFYENTEKEIVEFLKSLYLLKETADNPEIKEKLLVQKDTIKEDENQKTIATVNPALDTTFQDIQKYFSLNDKFYFLREIFENNPKKMNDTIGMLNTLSTYEESISYLENKLKWDMENQVSIKFMDFLERRFSNTII